MTLTLADWTQDRVLATIGTNAGSAPLPFQSWKPFKEAFAPELVSEAINASQVPIRTVYDPFCGSGTTGLAAQFLNVHPVLSEVNPYLADLSEAKLFSYVDGTLLSSFQELMRRIWEQPRDRDLVSNLPPTFVPPGKNGRYVFHLEAAEGVLAIRSAIDKLTDLAAARLFRVLLGTTLIEVSNIRVSGKGRRYRSGWESNQPAWRDVVTHFASHTMRALIDIRRFADRPSMTFELHRGDSRGHLLPADSTDLVVTSPPYPNSFDYTDVYNLELWMLGYFTSKEHNTALRKRTLSSHVQLKPIAREDPIESQTLESTVSQLDAVRDRLWSRHIPTMVGNYFRDLQDVLRSCRQTLVPGGDCWMVIGDSRYADVYIDVPGILKEISQPLGFTLVEDRPFRSMRSSPQQGGRKELEETLLVLRAS